MGTPRDLDARRYYRVAYQRLEDGSLMLEKLDRPKAAIYLTGYAVECMLKAMLLSKTTPHYRAAVLQSFRGVGGHDLTRLRARLTETRIVPPGDVAKELTYVSSWSVELRYEPGPGDRGDAQRFITSTRIILAWADRSI